MFKRWTSGLKVWSAILLAFWALSSCAGPTQEGVIVATTSIVADWVQQVVGDEETVVSLVGRDGDSHTYEPTPQDVKTLASARLIVAIGAGLEHDWLQPLVESSKTRAEVFKLAEHTTLLRGGHDHGHDEHEEHAHHEEHDEDDHEKADEHHHGEFDPHVWQSPRRVKDMVRALARKLGELTPSKAEVYRQRAEAYAAQLDELDREVRSLVEGIPPARRKLVVVHKAFGYFAEDYGFEQKASVLSSFTTGARDPSAADVARLVRILREEGIPAIFDENISKNPITAAIARDAGVRVAPTLYSDALGQPGTPGETYIGMMRYNARVIAEALR